MAIGSPQNDHKELFETQPYEILINRLAVEGGHDNNLLSRALDIVRMGTHLNSESKQVVDGLIEQATKKLRLFKED